MVLIISFIIFALSFVVLVVGADWFLKGAKNIGISLGISPFVIGVLILGFGTSFPELASSISGLIQGVPDIIVANAVGSNITNILAAVGFAAIFGRHLTISKNIVDIEIPVLLGATFVFVAIVLDGSVSRFESVILVIILISHLIYSIRGGVDRKYFETKEDRKERLRNLPQDTGLAIIGIASVTLGAHYLISSTIKISHSLGIPETIIAITAIALGTSLPEIVVSVRAAMSGRGEEALGNIFGSNIFNMAVIVGLPGLFTTLSVDYSTLIIGVPTLVAATILISFSGISKKIHIWEGVIYLLGYLMFLSFIFL